MANFRPILPKTGNERILNESANEQEEQQEMIELKFPHLISLMRDNLKQKTDMSIREIDRNISKTHLKKLKEAIVKELRQQEKIKIKSDELFYSWKCALLSDGAYETLRAIDNVQNLSHWYVRCLMEGLNCENLVEKGLDMWLKQGKLKTNKLKEINSILKSSKNDVEAEIVLADTTNTDSLRLKITNLQRKVFSLTTEKQLLAEEVKRLKIVTSQLEYDKGFLKVEIAALKESNKTAERENSMLRQNDAKHLQQLKSLEQRSAFSFEQSSYSNSRGEQAATDVQQKVSTPTKKKVSTPTKNKKQKQSAHFEIHPPREDVYTSDESDDLQEEGNKRININEISLNSTFDNPMSSLLLRYYGQSEENQNKQVSSTPVQDKKRRKIDPTDKPACENNGEITKETDQDDKESFVTKVENLIDPNDLSVDDWVLVVYDGTTFLGRVITITADQAKVLALSKKYGENEPQALERDNDAVWYGRGFIYKAPVEVKSVQVGRKYLWTY